MRRKARVGSVIAPRARTWIGRRPTLSRFAVLSALTLVTVLFLGTDVRFRVVAADLAPNLDFSAGLRGWGGSIGGVRLIEEEGRRILALEKRPGGPFPLAAHGLPAPQRFTHLRVGAELRTEGVVRGRKRLQRAGASLWSFDAAGRRLRFWPGELALLSGDKDWQRYERILPVHEAAASMRLYVYIGGRGGRLWARDLTVEPMTEIPGAAAARAGLLALWVLAGLWAAAPLLMQAGRRPSVLLVLVIGAGIAAGTLAPQPQLSQVLGTLIGDLRAVILPANDGPPVIAETPAIAETAGVAGTAGRTDADAGGNGSRAEGVPSAPAGRRATDRKTAPNAMAAGAKSGLDSSVWPRMDNPDRAHLLAFVLLGFAIGWAYRDRSPVLPFVFALLVAVISEILQYFTPSRDTEGPDLLFNLLGTSAGLAFAVLTRQLLRKGRLCMRLSFHRRD